MRVSYTSPMILTASPSKIQLIYQPTLYISKKTKWETTAPSFSFCWCHLGDAVQLSIFPCAFQPKLMQLIVFIFNTWYSLFQGHILSHRVEVLSQSYRNTGYLDGYTTTACMGQRFGTEMQDIYEIKYSVRLLILFG